MTKKRRGGRGLKGGGVAVQNNKVRSNEGGGVDERRKRKES